MVQHNSSKSKRSRKQLDFEDESSLDESSSCALTLSDLSSDDISSENDNTSDDAFEQPEIVFPAIAGNVNVGDYTLVEFDTLPKKYYVGRITKPQDHEGDFEIPYLRRKRCSWEFFSH